MAKKKSAEIQHGENMETVALAKYTEVQTIPAQLLETVENSGLELSKAERYAVGYAPLMGEVIEQAALLKGLDKTSVEDAAKAKRVSLDLGKICSRLVDKKKQDKELILVETRLIDGLFNVAESTARLTQAEANFIVDYLPGLGRELAIKRREMRIAELLEYGVDKSYLPLGTMTEEQYVALLDDTKLAHTARIERAEREENERLEREEKARQEQAERDEAERLRLEEQERELSEMKAQREQEAQKFELQQQLRKENADKLVAALVFEGFEPDENELSWSKCGSWYLTYDQLADMGIGEFDAEIKRIHEWIGEKKAMEAELKRRDEEIETERKNNIAKEAREAEQNRRRELLFGMGLKWDGESFSYRGIVIHWLDALTMEVEKFDKLYDRAINDMQLIKHNEEREAERMRLENERMANELSEEKERQFQEQFIKEKDAKAALLAPDKDKLTVLYNALDGIQLPNVTSPEAKAITALVTKTLGDLKKQFVELAKTMV